MNKLIERLEFASKSTTPVWVKELKKAFKKFFPAGETVEQESDSVNNLQKKTYSRVRRIFKTGSNPNSFSLVVTAKHRDPKTAKTYAQVYLDLFIEWQLQVRYAGIVKTLNIYEDYMFEQGIRTAGSSAKITGGKPSDKEVAKFRQTERELLEEIKDAKSDYSEQESRRLQHISRLTQELNQLKVRLKSSHPLISEKREEASMEMTIG